MAQTYQSKDSAVQSVQLKVQEVCVKLSDNSVVSTSGNTATINVQEEIKEVRSAIFVDDSAGTATPIASADQSISGSSVTLDLGVAMAAADSITMKYVVKE